jgi:hypothetical protein
MEGDEDRWRGKHGFLIGVPPPPSVFIGGKILDIDKPLRFGYNIQ